MMGFNIVLIEPEIPMNTGNIGRLCLASNAQLHLVKPFGFELDDSRVKRAGLDYWKHVNLHIYENKAAFFLAHQGKRMAFFSSHGKNSYWDLNYEDDMFLIFGKESTGLASEITEKYADELYSIPIFSEHVRSLNLANAASIIVYEGIRQTQNADLRSLKG
jgi:tRNA (cytidine/uridine-2'-O-)-methyltransferase